MNGHPIEVEQPEFENRPRLPSHGWLERLEEITSGTFFLGMIIVILVGIIWRFVLNSPLVWTINISTLCFMWAVLLGAPLSDWEDNHIQFDLLYNIIPGWAQVRMRLFGNLLLVATFGAIITPTISYLESLGDRTIVGAQWLRVQWAYSSFIIFLALSIIQRIRLIFFDVRRIVDGRRKGTL